VLWATAHRLQRPSSRWTKRRPCTNFQFGPLKWGCSMWPPPTASVCQGRSAIIHKGGPDPSVHSTKGSANETKITFAEQGRLYARSHP
jgi:hypothetical protein